MGFFTSANAIANPCNIPKRWEDALNKLDKHLNKAAHQDGEEDR